MRFSDKVCIVSGGASGIGRAACEKLAEEGGRIAVVDIDEDQGREVAAALTRSARDVAFFAADVGVSKDVRSAVGKVVGRWGTIDVLVNCAARMTFKRVVDLDEEEWDGVLSTNLRSVFLLCKYSLPHMPPGGAIVNVSSVHARRTTPNVAPYAASKGGIEAFTRALSQECREDGVRVNCVTPGAVDAPLLWANPLVSTGEEEIGDRVGQPVDIAAAITFLASGDARFITGASLVVDGGRLAVL